MEAPSKVGLYQVRCEEGENEWDYVAITCGHRGLEVHDPHIGVYDLASYHSNLTGIEWKYIV